MLQKFTQYLLVLIFSASCNVFPFIILAQDVKPSTGNKISKGALRQKLFFERLHYPFTMPGADFYRDLSDKINSLPADGGMNKSAAVNSWKYFGGDGVKVNLGNTKFSGRIRNFDLRSGDNNSLRVVTASGGLWRYDVSSGTPVAVSMSDQLSTLWGGAYVSDPADSTIGYFGTGEFGVHGGTGLFKTTDNGLTWSSVPMTPTPSSFAKIMYAPGNTSIMHAATAEGYYRSNDGGTTWTRKFFFPGGSCSDVVVNAQNTSILYLAYWQHGVYKSTDGGDNWVIQSGLPTTNVGRTALTIGTVNPDVVYVNMTNNNNNTTKGIYKTTNGGSTWTTCTFGNDLSGNPGTGEFHWGQGWYNNTIAVCPTNDNIVLAGGGGMWRSFDGTVFTEINARHADQHAIVWNPNGTDVFIGNDGGVFFSSNAGFSFSTVNASNFNSLPVSQYYHFSIGKTNANVVAGTTQDNGFHYKSYATGGLWNCKGGGDGAGVQVDPIDSNVIIYANGIYGDALQSHRFLSIDAGANFNNVDVGIDTCGDWFPEIRISPVLGIYYTACEKNVYYSNNQGNTWNLLNPGIPMNSNVSDFTVSYDGVYDPTVYACLGTAVKLMVYDGVTQQWVNRSAGLPANTYIRKVAVDILDGDVAYALAGGQPGNGAGNKVFKTTDRGQNWVNISGNLPNVSVTDLIAYPGNSNLLYLGAEQGCFKSIDGGASWTLWNNGMPATPLVNEFDYVDSLAINGTFWIGACTYGRGIWIREVSGDDPVGITEFSNQHLFLAQNSENPGNGITKIVYANSYNGHVTLTITDITGKIIAMPVNEILPSGRHHVLYNRSGLEAGLYFYTLSNGRQSVTKKMIVSGY